LLFLYGVAGVVMMGVAVWVSGSDEAAKAVLSVFSGIASGAIWGGIRDIYSNVVRFAEGGLSDEGPKPGVFETVAEGTERLNSIVDGRPED